MVLVAVNRLLRQRGDTGQPDLMQLLDLVALATVCDVVPLTGLNRAFVVRGLEVARRAANRGIGALALAARVTGPLNPYHLGFLIGPRINAGGRIGDAALGTRLLALDDEHEALVIAARLNELNIERQRIEIEALDEALARRRGRDRRRARGRRCWCSRPPTGIRASSASSPAVSANASTAQPSSSRCSPTAPASVPAARCPASISATP